MVCSIAFLALAIEQVHWSDVWAAAQGLRWFPFVPLAVTTYLVGHFVRGWRTRRLLQRFAVLPVVTATNVVVTGYAANNVLPARGGELVRAGMLAERSGVTLSQTLTVTLLERVLDGLVIVGLLALTLPLLPEGGALPSVVVPAAVVFGLLTTALVVAVVAPQVLLRTLPHAAGRLRASWFEPMFRWTLGITNGVAELRTGRGTLQALALTTLIWVLEAGMFLWILPAFGLAPNPLWAVLAMTVTNLGILLPSSPGFVGPFHYFCAQALLVVGVPGDVGLAYALVVHAVFFVPITVWGLASLAWYGSSFGTHLALARSANDAQETGTRSGVPVSLVRTAQVVANPAAESRFLAMLVDAALPLDDELGSCERGPTTDRVTTFVHRQLAALPSRLRVLFSLGTVAFRLHVAVRHLRPFENLSHERRAAAFDRWAYGPIAPCRQLFRVVRSTALLAYYDAPAPEDTP